MKIIREDRHPKIKHTHLNREPIVEAPEEDDVDTKNIDPTDKEQTDADIAAQQQEQPQTSTLTLDDIKRDWTNLKTGRIVSDTRTGAFGKAIKKALGDAIMDAGGGLKDLGSAIGSVTNAIAHPVTAFRDWNDLTKSSGVKDILPPSARNKENLLSDLNDKAFALAISNGSTDDIKDANAKTNFSKLRNILKFEYPDFIDKYLKWDQVRPDNEFIKLLKKYDLSVMNERQIVDLYNAYTDGKITDELIDSSNELADLTTAIRNRKNTEYKQRGNRSRDEVIKDTAKQIVDNKITGDELDKAVDIENKSREKSNNANNA